MISVVELYQDAARDDANKSENGYLSYEMFNRYLRRAELILLKFLTGDLVMAPDFPEPYNKQKCKDYLKRFIAIHKANNAFEVPKDYYYWDNLYKIGDFKKQDCENEDEVNIEEHCDTSIPILDGQVFNSRCKSYVPGLKPSQGSPIAKIVDNKVITAPKNIGSMTLEYIRYPKYGRIEVIIDRKYNDEVPGPLSVNCEWDEWAREPLVWVIVNLFSKHTREKALREMNTQDKPRG